MATRKEKGKGDTLMAGRGCLKMTNITKNCKAFCEVCDHGVYNMEKHVQTEEHKRNVRRYPSTRHLNGGSIIKEVKMKG